MLSKSLLLTLSSQPTDEDFLTAAFAYFLQNNPKVLRKYVRWLGFSPPSRMTLSIHKAYGKARDSIIDMEITGGKNFILFQENKTESTDTRDQRFRYAKILSEGDEKVKTLIYVTKYRETKKFKGRSNVCFKHKRWHEITSFLNTLSLTRHADWMRNELCLYLEEKNMASQRALDLSKLNTGWKMFVPQKCTLEFLFREVEVLLKNEFEQDGFRFKLYLQDDNMGLSVLRDKGRILKPLMDKEKIQAWVGIYYWKDGQTYLSSWIAWHKNYADKIKPRFHSLLREKGFRSDPDDDNTLEEFHRGDKSPASVLGKSQHVEGQSRRLSKWVTQEAITVTDLLSRLERSYWRK